VLLYRGTEQLMIDDIQCAPVDAFLRKLHPARGLPFVR
jgi:hypothetical protein